MFIIIFYKWTNVEVIIYLTEIESQFERNKDEEMVCYEDSDLEEALEDIEEESKESGRLNRDAVKLMKEYRYTDIMEVDYDIEQMLFKQKQETSLIYLNLYAHYNLLILIRKKIAKDI